LNDTFKGDPFRNISHAHYIREGLDMRHRIKYFSSHYLIESALWNQSYLDSLYAWEALRTMAREWSTILLSNFTRTWDWASPEGELEVSLNYRDLVLHRSFTWLAKENCTAPSLIIGESKGLSRSRVDTDPEVAEAFEAFTQQFAVRFVSMGFFCFAELQGIARSAGCNKVYGVRASEQLSAAQKQRFAAYQRAYDEFWRALGGRDDGDIGFRIELPVRT
jgi:uncharacterized protein VirK/YbjX